VETNQSANSALAEPENSDLADALPEKCGIVSACERLQAAENLLLNPNMPAITSVGFVLQEAQSLIESDIDPTGAAEKLIEFQARCKRVKALLEGALRVQWTYIHRISSTTSTYTAGPRTKRWIPPASTLSLEA